MVNFNEKEYENMVQTIDIYAKDLGKFLTILRHNSYNYMVENFDDDDDTDAMVRVSFANEYDFNSISNIIEYVSTQKAYKEQKEDEEDEEGGY